MSTAAVIRAQTDPTAIVHVDGQTWRLTIPAEMLFLDGRAWLENQAGVRWKDSEICEAEDDAELARDMRSQAAALESVIRGGVGTSCRSNIAEALYPQHRNRLLLPLAPQGHAELTAYARMLVQFGQASNDPASFGLLIRPTGVEVLATPTTRHIVTYAAGSATRIVPQAELEEVIAGL